MADTVTAKLKFDVDTTDLEHAKKELDLVTRDEVRRMILEVVRKDSMTHAYRIRCGAT